MSSTSLRFALLSRVLGVTIAAALLLTLWSGVMAWYSARSLALQWTSSLATRMNIEFATLRNALKTRSLKLVVGNETPEPGEALLEIEPDGRSASSSGDQALGEALRQALAERPDRFQHEDFYLLEQTIVYAVPETFLQGEGKRRALYAKALDHTYARGLAETTGTEVVFTSHGRPFAASFANTDGKPVLPAFPGGLVADVRSGQHYPAGVTDLEVPGYGGFKMGAVQVLRGAKRFPVYYAAVRLLSNAEGTIGQLLVTLPEEAVMRGPRQVIYGSVGFGIAFALLAVLLMSRTIHGIASPVRAIANRLKALGDEIAESVGTTEGAVPADATAAARTPLVPFTLREPHAIEEIQMLDVAAQRLAGEVGRSQHYQELLRHTQVALERSNKDLTEFAHTVAHDLRAPLRSIDGFSRILVDEHAKTLGDAGCSLLERVRAASSRMSQLIDDLLALSRLSRVEINRERIDLSALGRAVANELRGREPDRKVEFVIAEGLVVDAAGPLLRTVVENLLGNAWKFTAKHPSGRIELGMTVEGTERVYFVRDDGAGFDMKHAEKLFGVFQRLHGPKEFPGTGVGLASVARILARHGGRIWAEGEVEKGATFRFTLPKGEA